MTIYNILQTAADPELTPALLETSYQNYDDAVAAAKQAIQNSQADYEPNTTEIVTNYSADERVNGYELWSKGQDHWLESAEICTSELK